MRILLVNWQDLENPQAGGAEVHFFEIFSRIAAAGHAVTLVTSGWPGTPPRATVQGLDVRRVGGRHSFALLGRGAVRRVLREAAWDVVVEDINKLQERLGGPQEHGQPLGRVGHRRDRPPAVRPGQGGLGAPRHRGCRLRREEHNGHPKGATGFGVVLTVSYLQPLLK